MELTCRNTKEFKQKLISLFATMLVTFSVFSFLIFNTLKYKACTEKYYEKDGYFENVNTDELWNKHVIQLKYKL